METVSSTIITTFPGFYCALESLGVLIKTPFGDFSGDPVAKISPSNAGEGSVSGWGARIPHASRQKKQNKTKHKNRSNVVKISIKTLKKIVHIKKS